jgi:hypothetical protein
MPITAMTTNNSTIVKPRESFHKLIPYPNPEGPSCGPNNVADQNIWRVGSHCRPDISF